MSVFLKTFFACLILTICFLTYNNFSIDSYSDLNISKNNPVFGLHDYTDKQKTDTKVNDMADNKSDINVKRYINKCYFYSKSGKLMLVERKTTLKPNLENSLKILFKGPTIQEARNGIYSEIPSDVDLISVQRKNNKVIVDVTSNFGIGGGTQSIEDRIKQITKTIKIYESGKNIYLYINGEEVEYLGGEGVYVRQPLI